MEFEIECVVTLSNRYASRQVDKKRGLKSRADHRKLNENNLNDDQFINNFKNFQVYIFLRN